MPKISAFEKYFDRYENWFIENKYAYLSELDAIKFLMPKFKKGLEVGIGTGRFALPLGIKIGIEPSSQMRKIAVEKGLTVLEGVAENLPFKNFNFSQTIFKNLDEIREKEAVKYGFGKGSFVVVSAKKISSK